MSTRIAARERIRSLTPWWAKMALKLAFAKSPLPYSYLRWLGLARHGGMENPAFAFDAFRRHYDHVEFRNKRGGFSMLELGPGDSLFNAIIATAFGATQIFMVDVGPFANPDLRLYRDMAAFLRSNGLA